MKDKEDHYTEFQSKEFVSCAFSPKSEKNHMITLTGEPDWTLIFWEWEKMKILATINIGLTGISPNPYSFKCSFNMFDQNAIVVSGHGIFKYYKIREQNSEFVADHTQVNSKDRNISTHYSCHTWMMDTGRLVLCTENGEILILDSNGEYKAFAQDSPVGVKLRCVVPYNKGFIVGGENGEVFVYETNNDDPRSLC